MKARIGRAFYGWLISSFLKAKLQVDQCVVPQNQPSNFYEGGWRGLCSKEPVPISRIERLEKPTFERTGSNFSYGTDFGDRQDAKYAERISNLANATGAAKFPGFRPNSR